MSKASIIQKLEQGQQKSQVCDFRVGDSIRVHTRIIEGEKERVQVFAGTVIARKGSGLSETFSVHRVAYGEGMERVFLLHSPRIAKIELIQEGSVRRSKLYYLRGTSGKASKVKPRFRSKTSRAALAANNAAVEVSGAELNQEPAQASSATNES
ncbi:MAG: 50S ribosomal protein L19 [Parachlamydiaceae bacterium]|nr:50S ribosomal protein L19 [Parachlamydiaceae bacterium]